MHRGRIAKVGKHWSLLPKTITWQSCAFCLDGKSMHPGPTAGKEAYSLMRQCTAGRLWFGCYWRRESMHHGLISRMARRWS